MAPRPSSLVHARRACSIGASKLQQKTQQRHERTPGQKDSEQHNQQLINKKLRLPSSSASFRRKHSSSSSIHAGAAAVREKLTDITTNAAGTCNGEMPLRDAAAAARSKDKLACSRAQPEMREICAPSKGKPSETQAPRKQLPPPVTARKPRIEAASVLADKSADAAAGRMKGKTVAKDAASVYNKSAGANVPPMGHGKNKSAAAAAATEVAAPRKAAVPGKVGKAAPAAESAAASGRAAAPEETATSRLAATSRTAAAVPGRGVQSLREKTAIPKPAETDKSSSCNFRDKEGFLLPRPIRQRVQKNLQQQYTPEHQFSLQQRHSSSPLEKELGKKRVSETSQEEHKQRGKVAGEHSKQNTVNQDNVGREKSTTSVKERAATTSSRTPRTRTVASARAALSDRLVGGGGTECTARGRKSKCSSFRLKQVENESHSSSSSRSSSDLSSSTSDSNSSDEDYEEPSHSSMKHKSVALHRKQMHASQGNLSASVDDFWWHPSPQQQRNFVLNGGAIINSNSRVTKLVLPVRLQSSIEAGSTRTSARHVGSTSKSLDCPLMLSTATTTSSLQQSRCVSGEEAKRGPVFFQQQQKTADTTAIVIRDRQTQQLSECISVEAVLEAPEKVATAIATELNAAASLKQTSNSSSSARLLLSHSNRLQEPSQNISEITQDRGIHCCARVASALGNFLLDAAGLPSPLFSAATFTPLLQEAQHVIDRISRRSKPHSSRDIISCDGISLGRYHQSRNIDKTPSSASGEQQKAALSSTLPLLDVAVRFSLSPAEAALLPFPCPVASSPAAAAAGQLLQRGAAQLLFAALRAATTIATPPHPARTAATDDIASDRSLKLSGQQQQQQQQDGQMHMMSMQQEQHTERFTSKRHIGGLERQRCALLETPAASFAGFRQALVLLFQHLVLHVDRNIINTFYEESHKPSMSSLPALLHLLLGWAHVSVRRMRCAAALAVVGFQRGLVACVATLRSEAASCQRKQKQQLNSSAAARNPHSQILYPHTTASSISPQAACTAQGLCFPLTTLDTAGSSKCYPPDARAGEKRSLSLRAHTTEERFLQQVQQLAHIQNALLQHLSLIIQCLSLRCQDVCSITRTVTLQQACILLRPLFSLYFDGSCALPSAVLATLTPPSLRKAATAAATERENPGVLAAAGGLRIVSASPSLPQDKTVLRAALSFFEETLRVVLQHRQQQELVRLRQQQQQTERMSTCSSEQQRREEEKAHSKNVHAELTNGSRNKISTRTGETATTQQQEKEYKDDDANDVQVALVFQLPSHVVTAAETFCRVALPLILLRCRESATEAPGIAAAALHALEPLAEYTHLQQQKEAINKETTAAAAGERGKIQKKATREQKATTGSSAAALISANSEAQDKQITDITEEAEAIATENETKGERSETHLPPLQLGEAEIDIILDVLWLSRHAAVARAAATLLNHLLLENALEVDDALQIKKNRSVDDKSKNGSTRDRKSRAPAGAVETDLRLLIQFCLAHLPRVSSSSSNSGEETVQAAKENQEDSKHLLFRCASRVIDGWWWSCGSARHQQVMLQLLLRHDSCSGHQDDLENNINSSSNTPHISSNTSHISSNFLPLDEDERTVLLHFLERSFCLGMLLQQKKCGSNTTQCTAKRTTAASSSNSWPQASSAAITVWGCCSGSSTRNSSNRSVRHTSSSRNSSSATAAGATGKRISHGSYKVDSDEEENDAAEKNEQREQQLFLAGVRTLLLTLPVLLREHEMHPHQLYMLLMAFRWAASPPPCMQQHIRAALSPAAQSLSLGVALEEHEAASTKCTGVPSASVMKNTEGEQFLCMSPEANSLAKALENTFPSLYAPVTCNCTSPLLVSLLQLTETKHPAFSRLLPTAGSLPGISFDTSFPHPAAAVAGYYSTTTPSVAATAATCNSASPVGICAAREGGLVVLVTVLQSLSRLCASPHTSSLCVRAATGALANAAIALRPLMQLLQQQQQQQQSYTHPTAAAASLPASISIKNSPSFSVLQLLHSHLLQQTASSVENIHRIVFVSPAAVKEGITGAATAAASAAKTATEDICERIDPPIFDLQRVEREPCLALQLRGLLQQFEDELLRLSVFLSCCFPLVASAGNRYEMNRVAGEKIKGNVVEEIEEEEQQQHLQTAADVEVAIAVLHIRVMASNACGALLPQVYVHRNKEQHTDHDNTTSASADVVFEIPSPALVLHAMDLLLAVYGHLALHIFALYARLRATLERLVDVHQTLSLQQATAETAAGVRVEQQRQQLMTWDEEAESYTQETAATRRGSTGSHSLPATAAATAAAGVPSTAGAAATVPTTEAAGGSGCMQPLSEENRTCNTEQQQQQQRRKTEKELMNDIPTATILRQRTGALCEQLQRACTEAQALRTRATVLLQALLETDQRPLLLLNALITILSLAQVEKALLDGRTSLSSHIHRLCSVHDSPPTAAATSLAAQEKEEATARDSHHMFLAKVDTLLSCMQPYEYIETDIKAIAAVFDYFLRNTLGEKISLAAGGTKPSPAGEDTCAATAAEAAAAAACVEHLAAAGAAAAVVSPNAICDYPTLPVLIPFKSSSSGSRKKSSKKNSHPVQSSNNIHSTMLLPACYSSLLAAARYDAHAAASLDALLRPVDKEQQQQVSPPHSPRHASSSNTSENVGSCAANSNTTYDKGRSSNPKKNKKEEEYKEEQQQQIVLKQGLGIACAQLLRRCCIQDAALTFGGLGKTLLKLLHHPNAAAAKEASLFFLFLKKKNYRALLQLLLQTAQELFEAQLLTPVVLLYQQQQQNSFSTPEQQQQQTTVHQLPMIQQENLGQAERDNVGVSVTLDEKRRKTEDISFLEKDQRKKIEVMLLIEKAQEQLMLLQEWSNTVVQRLTAGATGKNTSEPTQQVELLRFWQAAVQYNHHLAAAATAAASTGGMSNSLYQRGSYSIVQEQQQNQQHRQQQELLEKWEAEEEEEERENLRARAYVLLLLRKQKKHVAVEFLDILRPLMQRQLVSPRLQQHLYQALRSHFFYQQKHRATTVVSLAADTSSDTGVTCNTAVVSDAAAGDMDSAGTAGVAADELKWEASAEMRLLDTYYAGVSACNTSSNNSSTKSSSNSSSNSSNNNDSNNNCGREADNNPHSLLPRAEKEHQQHLLQRREWSAAATAETVGAEGSTAVAAVLRDTSKTAADEIERQHNIAGERPSAREDREAQEEVIDVQKRKQKQKAIERMRWQRQHREERDAAAQRQRQCATAQQQQQEVAQQQQKAQQQHGVQQQQQPQQQQHKQRLQSQQKSRCCHVQNSEEEENWDICVEIEASDDDEAESKWMVKGGRVDAVAGAARQQKARTITARGAAAAALSGAIAEEKRAGNNTSGSGIEAAKALLNRPIESITAAAEERGVTAQTEKKRENCLFTTENDVAEKENGRNSVAAVGKTASLCVAKKDQQGTPNIAVAGGQRNEIAAPATGKTAAATGKTAAAAGKTGAELAAAPGEKLPEATARGKMGTIACGEGECSNNRQKPKYNGIEQQRQKRKREKQLPLEREASKKSHISLEKAWATEKGFPKVPASRIKEKEGLLSVPHAEEVRKRGKKTARRDVQQLSSVGFFEGEEEDEIEEEEQQQQRRETERRHQQHRKEEVQQQEHKEDEEDEEMQESCWAELEDEELLLQRMSEAVEMRIHPTNKEIITLKNAKKTEQKHHEEENVLIDASSRLQRFDTQKKNVVQKLNKRQQHGVSSNTSCEYSERGKKKKYTKQQHLSPDIDTPLEEEEEEEEREEEARIGGDCSEEEAAVGSDTTSFAGDLLDF